MGAFSKLLVVCAAAAAASLAAAIVNAHFRESKWHKKVERFMSELALACATPTENLLDIAECMKNEMIKGLEGAPGACLKMLPSYVDNLPDGSEVGPFYALDLGGTNFRVMRCLLCGTKGGVGKIEAVGGKITRELMTGTKEALFDMMASKLASFIAAETEEFRPMAARRRELGFTFSFPCDQAAINSGRLIHWTKGFNIPEAVGHDVVTMLEDALERQGVDIKVTALVNDAVGTLAGARYYDEDVQIGVILGTGSNACYEEKDDTSFRLVGSGRASCRTVVNMEWGNFTSSLLPMTKQDKEVDEASPNPGEQHFEKLVSGMYLGEIVRAVLADLQHDAGLFSDSRKLFERHALPTPDISKIHADKTIDLNVVGKVLHKSLGIEHSTFFQRKTVQGIVAIVACRGARLVGAAMFGVLKKIKRADGCQPTTVAVDGSLFESYSQYREALLESLNELLGKEDASSVKVVLSKDGSGIGAALLAASHSAYHWKHAPSWNMMAAA